MSDPHLPTPEAFLADFGIAVGPKPAATPAQARASVAHTGVSAEFRDLLIQYCATMIGAYELEEVNWVALAKRLGTQPIFLQEAATSLNQDGLLWNDVLATRIKRATAAKIFRDASWEQLESMALNKLMQLAEKNLIRDTGELLAIATQARRANEQKSSSQNPSGGNTVNINIGGDSMEGDNGLPAAGAKMTIDLSPRVASALQNRRNPQAEVGGRVIDGQMLSAAELRSALESQKQTSNEPGGEAESDTVTTDMFSEGDK